MGRREERIVRVRGKIGDIVGRARLITVDGDRKYIPLSVIKFTGTDHLDIEQWFAEEKELEWDEEV